MKKILLSIAAIFLLSGYCFAQTGNNQVGIGAEADFLLGASYSNAYSVGFGGNVKGLYGVGTAGQLTLTAGYSSYGGKSGTVFSSQTLSLVPILAGYRHNLPSNFYGEVQLGVGILTTSATNFSFSQTNFAAAANVGYAKNGFDASVRYYTEGDVMSQFAIRLAYNFSFKK